MTATTTTMKSLAPVLFVEEIEPCLSFWVDRLGFTTVVEVPEGEKLGFVILAKDDVQVMYQSRASVEKDIPALAARPLGHSTVLYIQVADLDAVERGMQGVEFVVPRRKTFYGATEIFVREPGGNVVAFAESE